MLSVLFDSHLFHLQLIFILRLVSFKKPSSFFPPAASLRVPKPSFQSPSKILDWPPFLRRPWGHQGRPGILVSVARTLRLGTVLGSKQESISVLVMEKLTSCNLGLRFALEPKVIPLLFCLKDICKLPPSNYSSFFSL